MINNKILGFLGLCAKSGRLCFGADSVEQEIKRKKVKLVVIAEDSSERTKTKFQTLCDSYNVPIVITGKIADISKAIGKNNKAIIGIKEENIAKQIEKINYGGEGIG